MTGSIIILHFFKKAFNIHPIPIDNSPYPQKDLAVPMTHFQISFLLPM